MSASAHKLASPRVKLSFAPSDDPIGEPVEGGMFISDEQLSRIHADPMKARKILRTMLAEAKAPKVIRGPTAKPDEVRIAGPNDEQAIFDLAVLDLQENAASVAPIDMAQVRELVRLGTQHKEGVVIGVIDGPDGKPVAFQILRPERWWWSKAFYLCKMVDFVHPDHRKSDHAAKLIQFAKWATDFWTQDFGYQTYLLSGVLATMRMRGKVRLYSRRLTPIGAYFLYPYPGLMKEEDTMFPFRDI